MSGFKEFGENYERVPLKIIAHEKNRLVPDIDYTTEKNGASYWALPKNFKHPKCSGRTPLCKEVLNDTYVSIPSWSEESTLVASRKTRYEKIVYRIEDERFELDMAIQTNNQNIQVLENVQQKINKMTAEEKSKFSLDDNLGGTSTVLHQRALYRIYGNKITEIVEGLKRVPVVAVPLVLKRMKSKVEDWNKLQQEFNVIWSKQMDKYYVKSLDHQGINFKQNDIKRFGPKNLLNEIEEIHIEKKAGPAFDSPHFSLKFKEVCVLDAINLICQYLKMLPGVFRDDRCRIEHLVRHFIPDFLGFPCSFVEEGTEKPYNQTYINTARDEALSDQDEFFSVKKNGMSDGPDKSSFIEKINIFDKIDRLHPTNMPYILFFVSKNWFVFFRQFHILCERLASLLHESAKKDLPSPKIYEDGMQNEIHKAMETKSYTVFIKTLGQLLSGVIDHAQFEYKARSLFNIHAFVSFTMDKLIRSIVQQLLQIVGDDISKKCTTLFFQHTKLIADIGCSSPVQTLQIDTEYLKNVVQVLEDEKCFKIVRFKEFHTVTIELIEEASENVEDLRVVKEQSNNVDAYVAKNSLCEEILSHAQGLPFFLARNLKKQQDYWKRKAAYVDNFWKTKILKTQHPYSHLKSNASFKRKLKLKRVRSKMSRLHLKKKVRILRFHAARIM